MKTYTPLIYWFDKAAILATDIQQVTVPDTKTREVQRNCDRYYKIVTVSMQPEVRIWEYCWENDVHHVDFIAQLEGHNHSVNCCKFSPNGQMLATGDSDGILLIWQYSDEEIHVDPAADLDVPPNKENWKLNRQARVRHSGDINSVAWSPDSKVIATCSLDGTVAAHDAVTGKRLWDLRNFRNFPVGLSWDPLGRYLISCSTDRRLDIIDAQKGHRLRNFFTVSGLRTEINDTITDPEVPYKLFHDSQLVAFTRAADFSPCGTLLFVPAAHLEVAGSNVYGTYVIRRADFDLCRPHALLPSRKATVFVRCSPIVYKLRENDEENFLGLPYRVVFGVLTKESITIYDTQHALPIMYVDNLHYDVISGFSWAPDGKNIVLSSLEGYNTFISDFEDQLGERTEVPEISEELIDVLKKSKEAKSAKKKKESKLETPKEMEAETTPSSKVAKKETPNRTPKSAPISQFFNPTPKSTKSKETPKQSSPKETPKPPASTKETSKPQSPTSTKENSKPKKRIETIFLD